MKLEPVIGLEIHVQLKTASKMFCDCSVHIDPHAAPNTNVCPICLGHPGTLPAPNEETLRLAILLGLALHGDITKQSKFDRKHYFYPDLPKGYQISQYDMPVVSGGYLDIHVPSQKERPDVRIGITRAHLEEDAAKNIHAGGSTLIDFNRAGTPLLEIVTEPDFHSPEEAKCFLQELRLLIRTLKLSSADMEKGEMRCDANISLREIDEDENAIGARFNPKTEVKNINSFRNVERALKFEIERQTKLWMEHTPPMNDTTRGWNDKLMKTVEQRTKEGAADYRYFPEPDIPAFDLTELTESLRDTLPELPWNKRMRFEEEYGFSKDDAKALTDDPDYAEFTEQVLSELGGWLESMPNVLPEDVPEAQKKFTKLVANWILHKLTGLLNAIGSDLRIAKVTPENFAELLTLIGSNQVTQTNALKILETMLESGEDPTHVMEDKGFGKIQDENELANVVDKIIKNFPSEVDRFRSGELQLLKFFLGMIMKETNGTADPGAAKNILLVKLEATKKPE